MLVRSTVSVTLACASLALYAALENRTAPATSLSKIVSVAVAGVPRITGPLTTARLSSTVSSPSTPVSAHSGTLNVLLVCPGLNTTVPGLIGR